MSRRGFPWDRLGIEATDDAGTIRKAYADALRATNLDEDIAGYAELRRARDEALWLAAERRRQADAREREPGNDDGADLGLGALDHAPEKDGESLDWFGEDNDLWDHQDASWNDGPPRYRSALAPEPGPELDAAQAEAQAAWSRMLEILYPQGEPSEDAVTLAELDEGLAALATITDRADAADLAEHDALDGALADLFARTWPRSAPFVEPAAEAFRWLDEAGSLEERPALRFLNERLKGMRFHAKVQQADHPLHKAWVELSRPGRANVWDRFRVNRRDAYKLIAGIRQNFPELESHLDPQRVASWDAGQPQEGAPGIVPRIVRGLFIVLLVVAVPRVLSLWSTPEEGGKPPVNFIETGLSDAEIDARTRAIFGLDMDAVKRADPAFASDLLVALDKPEIVAPIDYVRMKALVSAEVAARPALRARAELKAIWLSAAQRQGGGACRKLIEGQPGQAALKLSPEDRAREQNLLRQLLYAKVLSHMPEGGETRYAIPGWLVSETLKRSGLSHQQLKSALGDPDSPERCRAETALAQAVAAAPDKVPEDVLKGL